MSIRISTVGVALSIAIMLLTIAIVNGFRREIGSKIAGFDAQISVTAPVTQPDDRSVVTLDDTLRSVLRQAAPEASIELAVRQPAMLKTDDAFSIVMFHAYDRDHDWTFVSDMLIDGSIADFTDDDSHNSIIISSTAARQLGLSVGHKINTAFFIDGRMRIRNFLVAAIYESGFAEYDKFVAFAPIHTLRRLLSLEPDQGTRIEIAGIPDDRIAPTHVAVYEALSRAYFSRTVDRVYDTTSILDSARQYFTWLNLLDTNVVVIILIMSVISVFTLIASLFVLILERVSMIGTFKTLGAPDSLIRHIFILLASRILLRGIVWGNIVALAFIIVQHTTHVLTLNPESYFISHVPVSITVTEVLILNAAAIVVGLLVMIVPSMIISSMRPATTIRFE